MNQDNPSGKRCPHCGVTFVNPAEGFHRNRAQRDGWSPYCKECKTVTAKPPTPEQSEAGRTRSRERMRRIRATNPEYDKSAKAASYRKHREVYIQKRQAYVVANHDRVLAAQRLARQLHPERTRAHDHAKRTKRMAAPGTHTAADVRARYQAQGGRCWWCKKKVGRRYHVDHIFALANGGTNGPENICIACPECNQKKSAKTPLEFAGRLF